MSNLAPARDYGSKIAVEHAPVRLLAVTFSQENPDQSSAWLVATEHYILTP